MSLCHALVREIPATYAAATVRVRSAECIDVSRARQQHAAYVAGLRGCGCEILFAELAPELPDSCFVEDQAVVVGVHALITRSGNPGRRAEAEGIARSLRNHLDLQIMREGRLDGGDVLRVGSTLIVGRSDRTDDEGVRAVRRRFEPLGFRIREIAVPDWLHLKCICSALGPDRVLVARDTVPRRVFDGIADVVEVPVDEAYAANVVTIGTTALVAAGFRRTADIVAAAGYDVIELDVSEIRKGDGSLTCLSIVF